MITLLAPVSAQLLQRHLVSPKVLVLVSFCVVTIDMLLYSDNTLDVDSTRFAWNRCLRGFSYGLFLVPVNLIAYSPLRPDENNKASSLTNLFRNWGGSLESPSSQRRLSAVRIFINPYWVHRSTRPLRLFSKERFHLLGN